MLKRNTGVLKTLPLFFVQFHHHLEGIRDVQVRGLDRGKNNLVRLLPLPLVAQLLPLLGGVFESRGFAALAVLVDQAEHIRDATREDVRLDEFLGQHGAEDVRFKLKGVLSGKHSPLLALATPVVI